MNTILDIGTARVFYDGMLTEPRLDHPEGLAVAWDGSVWCGGELGQVYRIGPDGSSIEQVASTGGCCLGMAFDREDNLYLCDLKHAAVVRLDTKSGALERFGNLAGDRGIIFPTTRPSTRRDGCTSRTATPSRIPDRESSSSSTAQASSGTRSR
jgi:hypothetical protein